jgi:hypothetical protein
LSKERVLRLEDPNDNLMLFSAMASRYSKALKIYEKLPKEVPIHRN